MPSQQRYGNRSVKQKKKVKVSAAAQAPTQHNTVTAVPASILLSDCRTLPPYYVKSLYQADTHARQLLRAASRIKAAAKRYMQLQVESATILTSIATTVTNPDFITSEETSDTDPVTTYVLST